MKFITVITFVLIFGIIFILSIALAQKNNDMQLKHVSGCPTCATVEQIGLIKACKCPFGTELKKDIFGKTYCAQKTYECSTNWRGCEYTCPSSDSIKCDGPCFYPTNPL